MKKLINVSAKEFYDFVNSNNLIPSDKDCWVHETKYIDLQENVLASVETSSWSSHVDYKILAEENVESLNLVTNIMNNK